MPDARMHEPVSMAPASMNVGTDSECRGAAVLESHAPHRTVWDQFEVQAARFGSRLAVNDGRVSWTYHELRARAESLAGDIVTALGDQPTLVATLFDQSAAAIGAMMGVMRSGRPYVALDPRHPESWVQRQVAHLGVSLMVVPPGRREWAESIAPKGVGVAVFDGAAEVEHTSRHARPLPSIDPAGAACVLSTSGSTGEPKAAIKTHAGLMLSARHYIDGGRTTPEDRFLLLASPGFMASVPPILCSLLTGAALFPFDATAQGLEALVRFLDEHRITVFHSVPTLLRRLAQVRTSQSSLRSVRLVRLAGETVRASDIRLVREMFTRPASVHILMGAAETSLISQHVIEPNDPVPDGLVPVGRIASGVQVRIEDKSGREVDRGQTGRLVVRGRTISPGYWNNAGATREAFAADPKEPGCWSYRTSDTCRFRDDGLLELLGRTEEFIKVRGVRVSPAAIESALVEVDGVRDAAVVGLPDERGEECAVAYVVPRPGVRLLPGLLRRTLRDRVPEAMIPAQFVVLDALPLTANGKVDRHALPAPRPVDRPKWRRPRDDVECQVAAAWEHALGVENIGLDDRFDQLGGSSLEVVRVLLHLERVMSRPVPDAAMMLHDRVEDVAAAVARENVSRAVLVPLKATGTKRPFFCVHPGLGTVGSYGPLAAALDPDRPFYALQSPGISHGEEWPLSTVGAMADRYIREVESVDPRGPYLLGGVCMGGLVAWEMARRLSAAGRRVAFVALIETNAPGPRPGRTRTDQLKFFARHALRLVRWGVTRGAYRCAARPLPPGAWPGWRQFVHYANGAASRRYKPRRYDGPAAILMGRDEPVHAGKDLRAAMRDLADGPVSTALVPGAHHNICYGGHIQELAGVLRDLLDRAERGAEAGAGSS